MPMQKDLFSDYILAVKTSLFALLWSDIWKKQLKLLEGLEILNKIMLDPKLRKARGNN